MRKQSYHVMERDIVAGVVVEKERAASFLVELRHDMVQLTEPARRQRPARQVRLPSGVRRRNRWTIMM